MLLCGVGVCALVWLAWGNSIGGQPVFDDHFLVVDQTCFRSWNGVYRILAFEPHYACTYRPVRFVSYALDLAVFGESFRSHHIGNVMWHCFSALAVAALSAGLYRRANGSDEMTVAAVVFGFVVAVVWALHPVQTDSVSYVSGRRDVLVGFFVFASLLAALVAGERGGLWWLAVLWLMLFGFLTKEVAVVIPALYVAWRVIDGVRLKWLRDNAATAVALVVGLASSVGLVMYRGVFFTHSSRAFEWWGGSVVSNFATVSALQVRYLQQSVGAAPLIGDYHDYTLPVREGFGNVESIVGLALVAVLVGLGIAVRRRRPLIAFGIATYLIALAPVSHVFPHHELYAEHYLYIPLFGLVLAVVDASVWGLSQISAARGRWYGALALSVVCIACALAVVDRNEDWRNEEAFYTRVNELAPLNVRGLWNLGNIHFEAGRYDDALDRLYMIRDAYEPGSEAEFELLNRCARAGLETWRWRAGAACSRRLVERHGVESGGLELHAQLTAQAGRWAALNEELRVPALQRLATGPLRARFAELFARVPIAAVPRSARVGGDEGGVR